MPVSTSPHKPITDYIITQIHIDVYVYLVATGSFWTCTW